MSAEENLITNVLAGIMTMSIACGSTSEIVTACLALGRFEDLPEPYQAKRDAWERLDMRQRTIVRKYNSTFRGQQWDGPSVYGSGHY
ncbi:hypothetical protein V1290_005199 [Bradyrhizobium sp. AZCC 1578]|uniref:hypothetical protein n=1 Tax=unclassified Bradyrhizobium TaxID=2631580 RepID=UPI002FF39661